jgi:O-antigen/teichoic acid export membrane protein
VVSKLVTFAAFAYLARIAGPDGFGFVEFAGAVLLCAGLIVDQGFGPYGAREIARAPGRTATLVSEIVSARCALAVCVYATVIVLTLLFSRSALMTRLLIVYGLSLLAMPFFLQWVFQGHDRMHVVAATQVIRQTTFALVVFLFVRAAAQIWFVAVAEVAAACSAAAYTLWVYGRQFGGGIRFRLEGSRELWRDGLPIGLSQMFWVVRMFGATVIVGFVASPQDLGFFAGAQRILVAMHAFVWLYFFNLLPSMARAWQQSPAALAEVIDDSLRDIAWVVAAVGLVWVAVAPAVMIGVYGAAFAPAGSTLAWLAGVCVAAACSTHYRYGLIAAGRQTTEMVTEFVGSVVAVVCIPVGYRAWGPSGSAMGLCVAEVAVWATAWWYGRHLLGLRRQGGLLVRPVLAAAAAALLVRFAPLTSLGLRAVAAASCLVLLALLVDGNVRARLQQAVTLMRARVLGAES